MNIPSLSLPTPSAPAAPAAPAPTAPRAPAGAPAAAPTPASTCTQLRCTQADFDGARVAALRERIHSGSYQVNLGRVADGLLAHARDLGGGSRA